MEFIIVVSIYLVFFAVWAFLSMMTLFMMVRYHGLSLMTWAVALAYVLASGATLFITMIVVSKLEVDWTSLMYFFRASL
jgi:hypothetical protein